MPGTPHERSGGRSPWLLTRREVLRTAAVAAAGAPFAELLAATAMEPGRAGPVGRRTADPVELHWLEGPPAVQPGTAFGVPWPRGALPADTSFAAATEGGQPVPVDSWPLAYWPDGTLKWTGHALGAGVAAEGRVVLTPGAQPASPTGAPRVTTNETADAIEVDTGVVRCRVPKSGDQVIASVARDGLELLRGAHLVVYTVDRPYPEDAEGEEDTITRRQYRGWIEEAVVERAGPVRTVVRVKGTYRGSGRAWLPYTLRLYFHAGAESVRVVHYFYFDGDQHRDFINGLGLRWSVPMRDPLHDRHVRFVAEDDGVWGEAVRVLTGLRAPTPPAVRDAQFEGPASPPFSEWGPFNWAQEIEDVPVWNDYKLVQSSPDAFHIGKRTDAKGTWLLHAGSGRRAYGVGWLGGPTGGGIAFGLRDFWEKFPTQLDIRGAGTDEATVTVWFWSPDVPPMDLRDYDDERHGLTLMYQEPGRGLEDRVATPEGIARSHEVMLWALPATPSRARLLELASAVRRPPLLVADPEYYHSIQPFGVWSLPDRSTPARAALEDDIDRYIDFYRGQIEQRKWYGFWFYGDVMWGYDPARHVWRYDSGGHAWHQGELGFDQALWYQFLRTGRPEVFRMAEAMTLNIAEAAVHHIGFFAGLGSRHAVVKWGDGAKEARVSASQLKRPYYYLTADERVGDYMRNTLQADETMLRVPPFREIVPPPTKAPIHVRIGPDWVALVSNWLTEWERTGDTRWRDRIVRGMHDIAAMEHGMFTGREGAVGFDPATGALVDEGLSLSGSYHLSMLFGGDQVLYECIDLLDVPEFERVFMEFRVLYTGTPEERAARFGRDFNPGSQQNYYSRLMAYAGRRLDDRSYRERAWRTFRPEFGFLGEVQQVSGPAVVRPVEHAGNVFTNDAGQRILTIVQLLELAPEEAP